MYKDCTKNDPKQSTMLTTVSAMPSESTFLQHRKLPPNDLGMWLVDALLSELLKIKPHFLTSQNPESSCDDVQTESQGSVVPPILDVGTYRYSISPVSLFCAYVLLHLTE